MERGALLMNKKNILVFLPYFLALLFFAALLITGLMVYKDFGVPVDEPYQLELAIKNHRYIFHDDPTLLSDRDRYHGVVIELPLFWAATRFSGSESVYVRHLLLYFAFLASLALFYLLSLHIFRNPWWGLLAVCMLAVSPRIFSDAFYNSKDIVFMDVFILATWTLVLVIDIPEKRKWIYTYILILLHALTSSILIGTRIAGVMIVPLSVVLLGISNYRINNSWRNTFISIFLYLTMTAVLTIVLWPVLWHDPLLEFINAFQQQSKYEAYGKAVLFNGFYYPSEALPWHYLPVWIGISTPIIILAGFVIGIGEWIRSTIHSFQGATENTLKKFSRWISNPDTLPWLAVAGWLVVPIISIYLFHSVLYNGWRHLFFIYPAIILFATRGFFSLHNWLSHMTGRRTEITILIILVLAVGLFEPISFLSRYHRYGTVYFNQLAGDPKTIRQRFESDYWGLSYKEAIDYILATDPGDTIPIYMADVSGLDYINSELAPEQKSRLVVLDSPDDGARYFIGNYTFHPQEYQYSPSSPEYYSINVRGTKILVVYQFQ
jgi:hypothetical protein